MNYELPEIRTTIEGDSGTFPLLDVAMNWGKMPFDMLMSKFEETDVGPDEDLYDDYARSTLIDRRPDPAFTAADEPRGRVNATAARLQLQYYGHRGEAEPAAHPEMFLGFAGEENVDPRGFVVDPDFKRLTEQEQARMRYVRFTSDNGDAQITGGGISEWQTMANQQTAFRWVRDRLKVFSIQKDGRVEGIRHAWRQCSAKANQIKTDPSERYNDEINHDRSWVAQKKAVNIKALQCNTLRYREECTDADFEIQKYGQGRRPGADKDKSRRVLLGLEEGAMDDAGDSDKSVTFSTVGRLMNQIVKCRTMMQKTVQQDMEYGGHAATQARKHERATNDLTMILRSIVNQVDWGVGDYSMTIKTKMPSRLQHLSRVISLNHLLPAGHYLTADKMFKSVKPGNDTRRLKNHEIRDGKTADIEDVKSLFMKSARQRTDTDAIGGGAKNASNIDVEDLSMQTYNYKMARSMNGDRRIRVTDYEAFKKESDLTRRGRMNHEQYRNPTTGDTVQGGKFLENYSAERHAGPIGDKLAVRRHMAQDNGSGWNIS